MTPELIIVDHYKKKGSSRRLTLLVESLKTSKVKMRPDPPLI